MVKRAEPRRSGSQRCDAYTRVILIWRVVNSNSSLKSQSPTEGTRQLGVKWIGSFASFRTRVMVKSSETVPRKRSRISRRSKVVRRIAVEPPQQKFLLVSLPNAEATEAFQTPRNRDAMAPR